MDAVFPGFAEAMAKMREGGRYHFTMPKQLAFGNDSPPGFTGNSLTFDVQVRKIVRGGAAMMRAAQQGQQQGRAGQEQSTPPQQP
jgi:FKBP-type peptidyl-prolyl cis-trans isomerase FkpA